MFVWLETYLYISTFARICPVDELFFALCYTQLLPQYTVIRSRIIGF